MSSQLKTREPRSTTSSTRTCRAATFYVVRGSSDIRWRVELPVRHRKARLCSLKPKETRSFLEPDHEGRFLWRLTEQGAVYPDHEGAAVWTRPDETRATHAAAMSANGTRTLAEVDDNFLSPMDQNYF